MSRLSHSYSFVVAFYSLLCLFLSATLPPSAHAFSPMAVLSGTKPSTLLKKEELVNPDMTGIQEEACLDTAARIKRANVPVPVDVHPTGQVGISYAYWKAADKRSTQPKKKKNLPPVILIHGFDSSCLEYRRFGAQLAERGIDTYAVDLLGWGFTQLEGVTSFSAQAKVQALESFIETIVPGSTFVLGGASLGGAAAIEVAAAATAAATDDISFLKTKTCQGLILIDAQGFVDGIGPMASLPTPLAKLGVGVLKSNPLRSSANQMSYFDKKTYATDEAVVIGRVHTLREGWSDALVSFMQSGGFAPSAKVATIQAPSLILWGRQDGILDGTEYANKFLETLPDARLHWIEKCGHVPHLEQPAETAAVIQEFLEQVVESGSSTTTTKMSSNTFDFLSAKDTQTAAIPATLAALGALAGAVAADLLPLH